MPLINNSKAQKRFFNKVRKTDSCWLWRSAATTGRKGASGYGLFTIEKKSYYAHRLAWELSNGLPIPKGLVTDHLCRVTLCVNPAHLEVVTNKVNLNRGLTRSNLVVKCAKGHILTGNKLIAIRGIDSYSCNSCTLVRTSNWYYKKTSYQHTICAKTLTQC